MYLCMYVCVYVCMYVSVCIRKGKAVPQLEFSMFQTFCRTLLTMNGMEFPKH